MLKVSIPLLQDSIFKPDGTALLIKPFELNYLSAPGTALLAATFIAIPLLGMTYRQGISIYWETLKQLKFPIIIITSIVAFAFTTNYSGMSITMGMALASTGILFPFFSPVLGWLGVFLTGSDTSSNALFCKLQATSADTLGVDPVVTVSANASGGVTGKMISPQSIAIAAAAVGLVGKESDLFRFTIRHSFILLFVICILTCIQAYVAPWMIPEYELTTSTASTNLPTSQAGIMYLSIFGVVLLSLVATIAILNRRRLGRDGD